MDDKPDLDLDCHILKSFFNILWHILLHSFAPSMNLNSAVTAFEKEIYQKMSCFGTKWTPASNAFWICTSLRTSRVALRGHPYKSTEIPVSMDAEKSTLIS